MKATHNSVNFLSPTSSNYLHFGYLLQVLADLLRYQDPGKAILQISCICRKGRWDNIHNITDQHHCVHSWKIWRATLIRPNLETNYHGSNPGGQVGLIIYQILMSNLTFNFTILHSIMYTWYLTLSKMCVIDWLCNIFHMKNYMGPQTCNWLESRDGKFFVVFPWPSKFENIIKTRNITQRSAGSRY